MTVSPLSFALLKQGARAALFQGNIKAGDQKKAVVVLAEDYGITKARHYSRDVPKEGARAALFQGNIRAKRPEKGGGSISGKLWNNKETPIPGKTHAGRR